MPREYKARDKKVHKMTRDGLIEQNSATGDIENISKREQEFSLHTNQPDGQDMTVIKNRTGNIENQPEHMPNKHDSGNGQVSNSFSGAELPSQNEHLRKQQHLRNLQTPEQKIEAAQSATPHQDARNGAENISPPVGSEPEPINNKTEIVKRTNDTNRFTDKTAQPAQAEKHITDIPTEPLKLSGRSSEAQHFENTAEAPQKAGTTERPGRFRFSQDTERQKFNTERTASGDIQPEIPASVKTPQSQQTGKLQYERENQTNQRTPGANRRKNGKKLKSGNKYQQRFTQEAAQREKTPVSEYRQTEQTPQTTRMDDSPEVVNNVIPETPVTPNTAPHPQFSKTGKLKFTKNRVLNKSGKSGKPRQKGNKYQQRFTLKTKKTLNVHNGTMLNTPTVPDNIQVNTAPVLKDVKTEVAAPQNNQSKLQFNKGDKLTPKQVRSEQRRDRKKQKKQPKPKQADEKPVSKNIQPEKPLLQTDSNPTKFQEKPDKLKFNNEKSDTAKRKPSRKNKWYVDINKKEVDKKPALNNTQPEKLPDTVSGTQTDKTPLRTDSKPPKLQEKPGKLKFSNKKSDTVSRKPPRKNKRCTVIDEKASEKKSVPEDVKPKTDKPLSSDDSEKLKSPEKSSKLQFADEKKSPVERRDRPDKSRRSLRNGEKNNIPDKKLSRLQETSDKYNSKLEKARNKLPSKKKRKAVCTFDEGKGKSKTKLYFEKEILPPGSRKSTTLAPINFVKKGADNVRRTSVGKLHQKVYEVEHENVGVQAGHRVEQAAEGVYRGGKRVTRSAFSYVRNRPYRTVEKLEKKAIKADIRLSYRKALNDNPQLKSNVLSRFMQKRKIKQQYAKAARETKRAQKAVKKTGDVTASAAKAVAGVIKRHPVVTVVILLVLLIVFFIASLFSAAGGLAGTGLPTFIASSYLAEDSDINQSELDYTEWETDLLLQVQNAESNYPGYNEYRYNIDGVGHNPQELMAYLTAVYGEFHYDNIQAVLQQIFNEQYQLTFTPSMEIRYADPTDANDDGDYEPYDWNILTVTLTSRLFSEVIFPYLDSEQIGIYGLLTMSGGNRQYTGSPFDFNWLSNVTSYYGYRVHPITGVKDYHMGIDIAVPIGTDIQSAQDGTVTYAGYNGGYGCVVVIEDSNGLVTKYAHCDSLLVSVGQEIKAGDIIAMSGNTGDSTGPHVHFEVIKDGQYLNPIFFAATGAGAW